MIALSIRTSRTARPLALSFLFVVFALSACDRGSDAPAPAAPTAPTPEPTAAAAPAPAPAEGSAAEAEPDAEALKAARIATEIRANPEKAGEVLRREGMTVEAFEELLYRIAEDPKKSKDYVTAQ